VEPKNKWLSSGIRGAVSCRAVAKETPNDIRRTKIPLRASYESIEGQAEISALDLGTDGAHVGKY